MIIDVSAEEKSSQPSVEYLLVFGVSSLSLALFGLACACCLGHKEPRISGDEVKKTPAAAAEGPSPAPTVIRADHYKDCPKAATRLQSKGGNAERNQTTSEVNQKPLEGDPVQRKPSEIGRQNEGKTDVVRSSPKRQSSAKKPRRRTPVMEQRSRGDSWSSRTRTDRGSTTSSGHRHKKRRGLIRASRSSERRSLHATDRKSPLEYASYEDPAYFTLGLDVEDPFTLRSVNSVCASRNLVKPVPKTLLSPPPRFAKTSLYI